MPTDPFDPLRHIDPPDQWDDIATRAADGTLDVDLDEAEHRSGGRRTRALLAVAAALVLVVGGIALARSGGDDGREVATADTTLPSSTISGACPFSLEPGPGVPTLEPAPRPVDAPAAALDPPTVGVGRVGELRVAVAVSTFPPEAAPGGSRWSSYEEGAAIGWLAGEDPIQVLRTGDLGLGPDLLGVESGGRLGDPGDRCRDVLVQVVQPNPGAGTDATTTTQPGPGAQTSMARPDTTGAPTTTGPCPANARCVVPGDRETTTEPPTVAGSCAEGSGPCEDTVVPDSEPDSGDDDPAVVAETEARALIETVLDAIRFPGSDGTTASATASSTTTTVETIAPTTAATVDPGGRSTLQDETVVEGMLTNPAGTPFVVGEAPDRVGLCFVVSRLECDGDGPPPEVEPTPRAAFDGGTSGIYYGYLPIGADGASLISGGSLVVEAGISPDGRIWAVADPSSLPLSKAPGVTIRFTFPDGSVIDVPFSL